MKIDTEQGDQRFIVVVLGFGLKLLGCLGRDVCLFQPATWLRRVLAARFNVFNDATVSMFAASQFNSLVSFKRLRHEWKFMFARCLFKQRKSCFIHLNSHRVQPVKFILSNIWFGLRFVPYNRITSRNLWKIKTVEMFAVVCVCWRVSRGEEMTSNNFSPARSSLHN